MVFLLFDTWKIIINKRKFRFFSLPKFKVETLQSSSLRQIRSIKSHTTAVYKNEIYHLQKQKDTCSCGSIPTLVTWMQLQWFKATDSSSRFLPLLSHNWVLTFEKKAKLVLSLPLIKSGATNSIQKKCIPSEGLSFAVICDKNVQQIAQWSTMTPIQHPKLINMNMNPVDLQTDILKWRHPNIPHYYSNTLKFIS